MSHSERTLAAMPEYLRRIVTDLYKELAIDEATQAEIEQAMSELMERGQHLCVDFGILNAIDLASYYPRRTHDAHRSEYQRPRLARAPASE